MCEYVRDCTQSGMVGRLVCSSLSVVTDCFLRRARKNHVLVFFVLPVVAAGLESTRPPPTHTHRCVDHRISPPASPQPFDYFCFWWSVDDDVAVVMAFFFSFYAIIFSSARCLNERIKKRKQRACLMLWASIHRVSLVDIRISLVFGEGGFLHVICLVIRLKVAFTQDDGRI